MFVGTRRGMWQVKGDEVVPFDSLEAALEFIAKTDLSEPSFDLLLADGCTFAGRVETLGAGMAIVLDALLDRDYWPQGVEQKDGYRVYHYTKHDGTAEPEA